MTFPLESSFCEICDQVSGNVAVVIVYVYFFQNDYCDNFQRQTIDDAAEPLNC